MRTTILTLLLVVSTHLVQAQFSTYYYQKKSLFEKLPNDKNEIIFLGNSITDGCEWSEIFQNKKIKNRGISGDVTDGVLLRLAEVYESSPKKVFILIGINDLSRGKSQEYVFNNIQKIVQEIHQNSPKTKLFVQSLLPVNDCYGRFKKHTNKNEKVLWINKRLKESASKASYTFINIHDAFVNESGKMRKDYSNDGLHLLGDGYMAWVNIIKPYVK
ncbi:sialate O-acetylesterase [Halosquirtibacter xylanolyticus]|uniref:GDSL-type esterase/lipase family protein n=1 Tax=Halosquirtibacter xylanolyticus TaxID=3374599 RepID=UPI0037478AEB|nr:sialate O-acetylesterase [Prolixibacteraceae bacterium]